MHPSTALWTAQFNSGAEQSGCGLQGLCFLGFRNLGFWSRVKSGCDLQGLWWDAPSVMLLPWVTREAAALLAGQGLGELPQLAEALHQQQSMRRRLAEVLGSEAAAKECAQVGSIWTSVLVKVQPQPLPQLQSLRLVWPAVQRS